MACLRPNLMADKGPMYQGKERYQFLGSLKGYCEREGISADALLQNPHYMLIPCRKCLACQRAKAMDWATRAAQEIAYHPEGTTWFLTLTYDEESLPRWYKDDSEEGGHMERGPGDGEPCLWHKDIQDYHKRLRAAQEYAAEKRDEEPEQIRFLQCGEYGGRRGRPHYHEVISGLILPDVDWKKPENIRRGVPIYKSKWLEKMWPWGIVDIALGTQDSAAYVAQYTVKKAYDLEAEMAYKAKGVKPPYINVSRGYGSQWALDHWEDYVEKGVKMVVHTANGHRQAGPTAWARRRIKDTATPEQREEMRAEGQLWQMDNCNKLRRQHPGKGIIEANEEALDQLWKKVRQKSDNVDRKDTE